MEQRGDRIPPAKNMDPQTRVGDCARRATCTIVDVGAGLEEDRVSCAGLWKMVVAVVTIPLINFLLSSPKILYGIFEDYELDFQSIMNIE